MKFNEETQMYEATKFVAATNQEIIGMGKTREEARADLKKRVADYRAAALPVVGTFNSPGREIQEVDDLPAWEYNAKRKAQYLSRPSLAETLRVKHKEESKDK